jgi:hypothetical protein
VELWWWGAAGDGGAGESGAGEQGLGKVRARLIGDGRGEWAQVDEEAGTGFTVIVR